MAINSAAEKRSSRNIAFDISAAVIALIGLALVVGGIKLISLGGSFYYLLCGAATAASSCSSTCRSPARATPTRRG